MVNLAYKASPLLLITSFLSLQVVASPLDLFARHSTVCSASCLVQLSTKSRQLDRNIGSFNACEFDLRFCSKEKVHERS